MNAHSWKHLNTSMSVRTSLMFGMMLLCTPAKSAETEVQQLAEALQKNSTAEAVLRLTPRIVNLLRDEETAFEALPVVEQAAEILSSNADPKAEIAASTLLKAAARMRFEQGEPDKGIKRLESLRTLYKSLAKTISKEKTLDSADRRMASWNYVVALEFLHGEQLQKALEVLGEQVDLPTAGLEESSAAQAAVAGALHRRLDALSTDERYEILHRWTMPAQGRPNVRTFSSLASNESPPDVFARALGERPRPNAFPVPAVADVDGLFDTAWVLVRAAAESGRLRRLTAEFEDFSINKSKDKNNVPNAQFVLRLAQIADGSSDAAELQRNLDKELATLRAARNKPTKTQPPAALQKDTSMLDVTLDERQWWVVGAACLHRKELAPVGQRIFETLLELDSDSSYEFARPFLRRARAIAILKQHAGTNRDLLSDPQLKLWIPASEEIAQSSAAGAVREIWLLHEDHLMHLAGPGNDYLFFRYPLVGDFEFEVEAQFGGAEPTAANLAFGGLAYSLNGTTDELIVVELDQTFVKKRLFQFIRKEKWPTYQRLALHGSDTEISFSINGHPVWTQPVQQTTTSPWLALRCPGDAIPAFRNCQLRGRPDIKVPSSVNLAQGDTLRGWSQRFYSTDENENVQAVFSAPENTVAKIQPVNSSAAVTPPDWTIHEGVIRSIPQVKSVQVSEPSRLTYFRPLQSGESIEYEYFYEPGKQEVHPALGRLAFLLEPNGVRVRWMTNGDAEWTGLDSNHATIEPLNRRGPRPLPLKSGDWNRVSMELDKNTLTLKLNAVEIYSRKMEPSNSYRFSLYHDRQRTAAQVRSVVLRGNWPESLSADDLKDLLASQ